MNHKRLLILIMILLSTVFFYLWLEMKGMLSDFGLNAFTETIGILITVLLVDYLIKKQDELRSLPQKATAYEDVRLLTSRIICFWSDVYRLSVPENSPQNIESLFSETSFNKISHNLNMESTANVTPPLTWWDHLPNTLNEQREMARVILERHNNILEPIAYSQIHQIATEGMDPNIIKSIRLHDNKTGFPRPRVLASYYNFPDNYCETIIGLTKWCESNFKILRKNGITGLKEVSILSNWEGEQKPKSMIDPLDLLNQISRVDVFRERNKS